MAWYVAHAVMVLQPEQPLDGEIFCWENLLLIEASNEQDPWTIAEERARQIDASESFEAHPPYSVPAKWVFAGIRKLVSVRHDTQDDQLCSGDELSYNTLLFPNQAEIDKFVAGDSCNVRYQREYPEE
jgi:hypothetical protein